MGFDPHLDANLLAAWLEGGLTEGQRARLVRHIGACEGCRTWAACAQTAGAALPRREAAATRGAGWAAGPGLWRRWQAPLGLAASAALVAAVVWRLPRAVAPRAAAAPIRRLTAGHLPTPPAAKPRLQPHAAAVAPRPASFGVTSATAAAPPPPLAALAPPEPAQQATVQPSIDFAPLLTGFQDQPVLPVAGSSLAAWDGAVNQGGERVAAAPAVRITSAAPGTGGGNPTWPFASGFAGGGGQSEGPLAPSVASGLGWAISRGGEVLRSIGAGLWQAVPLVPGVHFRALAQVGDAVWAGGRADQLYFSPDHGSHWRAVRLPKLSAHPAPLRSIAFYDAHHGTVIAEDGRVWVTSDGGASWTAE